MHLNISGRIELPCKDDTIIYIEPYEIADSYFCTPPNNYGSVFMFQIYPGRDAVNLEAQ